ncbi:hypothetical protein [Desulfocastanea catecholica]
MYTFLPKEIAVNAVANTWSVTSVWTESAIDAEPAVQSAEAPLTQVTCIAVFAGKATLGPTNKTFAWVQVAEKDELAVRVTSIAKLANVQTAFLDKFINCPPIK